MTMLRNAMLALVLLAPLPALAESGDEPHGSRAAMLAGMSEPGRQLVMSTMGGVDGKSGHARIQATRDHMLDILDSDRLDVLALRRAMADERDAVSAQQARRQSAMLAAFEQLSVVDRKAFVVGARAVRNRIEQRAAANRDRHMQRMSMDWGVMPPR